MSSMYLHASPPPPPSCLSPSLVCNVSFLHFVAYVSTFKGNVPSFHIERVHRLTLLTWHPLSCYSHANVMDIQNFKNFGFHFLLSHILYPFCTLILIVQIYPSSLLTTNFWHSVSSYYYIFRYCKYVFLLILNKEEESFS